MNTQKINEFTIVGIKTRTQNDGRAASDIPALWNKLMSENLIAKITNRVDDAIYCLYTEYEGDHTMPYSVVLGCKVSDSENVPDGMIQLKVPESNTAKFLAKGKIEHGEAVVATWMDIWKSGLDRAFTTDYEVYDHRANNVQDAEVDIFIALK